MFKIKALYIMSDKKMSYKDKLGLWTASVSFILGWILTIANFVYPPFGIVADSTLWIMGQSLLYCGGIVGIAQYTKGQIKKIRHSVGLPPDEEDEED